MTTSPKLNVISYVEDERPGVRANLAKFFSGLSLSALSIVLGVMYERDELSFTFISGLVASAFLLALWFLAMCLREDRLVFSDLLFRVLLVALAVMIGIIFVLILGAEDSLKALIGTAVVGLWGSLMVWNVLTTWWPNNRDVRNRGD